MVEKALIEAFIVIVHNFKLRESSFPALLAAPNISVGGCCLTEANLSSHFTRRPVVTGW